MSRIHDLIVELCPNGVHVKALGEIGTLFGGLTGKSKADFTGGTARFVSYVNVFNNNEVNVRPEDFVHVKPGEQQRTLQRGDILFTGSSETPDEVGMSSVVTNMVSEPLYLNSFCIGYRLNDPSIIEPDFAKHLFRSDGMRKQITHTASGVTRFNVSKVRLSRIKVPVPPLEVQREIARILDTFTQLEAELEAELEARRVQYAYYRQLMLDQVDAEPATIGSLGKWYGGMTPSKGNPAYWESGTIPWLASMDVSDTSTDEIRGRVTALALEETSLRVIPSPSVAVVMRSNILRRVLPIGLIRVNTTVNQDMRALVPHEGVNADYVYQALRADSERIRSACVRTDGSMAAVDSKGFFAWQIPLPPLEEQLRIAQSLRKFEVLVSDLSIGLPAELAARRMQYQYYRDRLLTFEERPA